MKTAHIKSSISGLQMKTIPENITLCNLSVVLMPNGEVILLGKTIGMFKDLKKYLEIKGDGK